MLFNTLQFAIFFPIVTLLYFLLGPKGRGPMLLAASCYFYMAFVPKFILILIALILIDYTTGILIENSAGLTRKLLLGISLGSNIGMLGFFKYFNFFNENLAELARFLGWNYGISSLSILLPIGLSFHTFQSMSYTVEVYRGNFKAERSLLHFALYVLFYPQLVAGPIERPQNLLHQFHEHHRFNWSNFSGGLRLMALGLFKKVIIADRLAILVNAVYGNSQNSTGLQLLLATYFFAIQIYCDFSGYSDIARGAAKVMGIDLMRNFNRPYLATSLADFWRRWHISLSTWFRDYLYYPLGGNRVPKGRHCFNLFIVFLISGLWHGASWTFIIWGALHGIGLVLAVLTEKLRGRVAEFFGIKGTKLGKAIGIFFTFNFVSLTWIFFRASNLSQATMIISRIGHDFRFPIHSSLGLTPSQILLSILLVAGLLSVEFLRQHSPVLVANAGRSRWLRLSAYYLFAVIFVFLSLTSPQQAAQSFIYFQF